MTAIVADLCAHAAPQTGRKRISVWEQQLQAYHERHKDKVMSEILLLSPKKTWQLSERLDDGLTELICERSDSKSKGNVAHRSLPKS